MPAAIQSDLLSRDEAAAYLGVKAQTLAVWATTHRYHLPFIKVGNKVRYRLADLERWLSERTRTGNGEAVDANSQQQ